MPAQMADIGRTERKRRSVVSMSGSPRVVVDTPVAAKAASLTAARLLTMLSPSLARLPAADFKTAPANAETRFWPCLQEFSKDSVRPAHVSRSARAIDPGRPHKVLTPSAEHGRAMRQMAVSLSALTVS